MKTPTKQGLVLVPGLLCDAELWQPQISALSDVAECWVADHTRSETMADVAADVLQDAPFETFALAGLSMGGYVALEMFRQASRRIERLALLDTSARPDTPEQASRRAEFISLAERGRFVGVADTLLRMYIHPDRLSDGKLVNTIKKMARDTGRYAFIMEEKAIISRADSLPLLPSLNVPTLVLCGRQDALTPLDRHEEIAAAVPDAVLEVIEDCGHLSPLERPAEVSTALRRWLAA